MQVETIYKLFILYKFNFYNHASQIWRIKNFYIELCINIAIKSDL